MTCEDAWEKGVPFDREGFPVFLKPIFQCTFAVEGKRSYITAKDNAAIYKFIDRTPRFSDIGEAPDGIFTWILYRTAGGEETKFSAAQVKSALEVGTLHRAIAYATNAATIHGAGELKKMDGKIEINVQSGSFMANWKACDTAELSKLVLEKVRAFLPENVSDATDTFITQALAPTPDELKEYKQLGLTVCPYDDEAICKKDKGKICKVGGRRKTRRGKKKRRLTRKS
jgi:hypothetical protein